MIEYDWKTLSDNQFEDLCKDLLEEAGVDAKRVSGPGSGDMGCDVIAVEKVALKIGAIETHKILVQCKNYGKSKTTISPDEVEKYALRARSLGCDTLLIITSHDLSAQAKSIAEKISKNPEWNIRVSYWIEADLIGRLVKSPHLSEKYFGTFPHSKKIKCYDFSGMLWVPVTVTYGNKSAQTRLIVNMSTPNTSIPSATAEQLGVKFEPTKDFGNQMTQLNLFTAGTSILNNTKVLKDVVLGFQLLSEPSKPEFLKVILAEVHSYKDWIDIQGFAIEPFGFLGLDVLRNFSISMKEGMLYPE